MKRKFTIFAIRKPIHKLFDYSIRLLLLGILLIAASLIVKTLVPITNKTISILFTGVLDIGLIIAGVGAALELAGKLAGDTVKETIREELSDGEILTFEDLWHKAYDNHYWCRDWLHWRGGGWFRDRIEEIPGVVFTTKNGLEGYQLSS
jgi:hypothetical protein